MPERVMGLFKLGSREHLELLLHRGHIYMQPLSRFQRMEEDEVRADRDDGLYAFRRLSNATLSIEHEGAWRRLGVIDGEMRSSDAQLGDVNVFCMYAIKPSQIDEKLACVIDPRVEAFGDSYLALRDPMQFFARVRERVHALGFPLHGSLVEYVDRANYSGHMGPFRKFREYAYQQEWRMALATRTGQPYTLEVGSLADIAQIGDLSRLSQSIRIEALAPGVCQ